MLVHRLHLPWNCRLWNARFSCDYAERLSEKKHFVNEFLSFQGKHRYCFSYIWNILFAYVTFKRTVCALVLEVYSVFHKVVQRCVPPCFPPMVALFLLYDFKGREYNSSDTSTVLVVPSAKVYLIVCIENPPLISAAEGNGCSFLNNFLPFAFSVRSSIFCFWKIDRNGQISQR